MTRPVAQQPRRPRSDQPIEEDIPTPNAGEVRMNVLAAGVSLPDVLAREGMHLEAPRVPYTPRWVWLERSIGSVRASWLQVEQESCRNAAVTSELEVL
jgi:hypothetical protein